MSEGGSTARSDLWGGAGWTIFGALIVVESLRMERFTSMGAELYTMPGFVPGMIGGVLVLLGLVLMLRGWRRHVPQADAVDHEQPEKSMNRRVAMTLALSVVYAGGLIGRVPFWLATALFVAAFTWYFAPPEKTQSQRLVAAVTAGVLTAAVVTAVFQYVFLVRLP